MTQSSALSAVARDVRRHDRDRFVMALFAPSAVREALFTLYGFNIEIARVRELVSEPMLGQIRLQWWHDTLDSLYGGGRGADHPVAADLARIIADHSLSRSHFDSLLNARLTDLDNGPLPDLTALEDYAEGTSAALLFLALELLGVRDDAAFAAARHVGIAWALTGLLRAAPYHAAAGRIYLPFSLLDAHGVEVEDLLAGKPPAALTALGRELSERVRHHIAQARALHRDLPQAAVPALLAAALAESYLDRLAKTGFNLFDPQWSLTRPRPALLAWKAWRGRY